MARDVLKSDTCQLILPDLDVEIGQGALSSRFTTVEGLLEALRDLLSENGKFFFGDASTSKEKAKFQKVLDDIDDIKTLKKKGSKLILDDPAGNSYIMVYNYNFFLKLFK